MRAVPGMCRFATSSTSMASACGVTGAGNVIFLIGSLHHFEAHVNVLLLLLLLLIRGQNHTSELETTSSCWP